MFASYLCWRFPVCAQVILEDPVESWPLCDVLLSWHSEGFPLRKAQAYVELRRPFLINDGAYCNI